MRLSDLRNKPVVDEDGRTLGRVHEVHCEGGRVTALKIGPGGLIERLTAKSEGGRIAWECVISISDRQIRVGVKRSTGSRTRRRTRPASGRRSTR
jgi:sporulation protein YlmC with PRC-barrel domain